MNGERFRLVTMQDKREFVSTVSMSEEDAQSVLAVDTLLHRAAGWRVSEGRGVVVARRGNWPAHPAAATTIGFAKTTLMNRVGKALGRP